MRVEINLDRLEDSLFEKIRGVNVLPKELEISIIELGKDYVYDTYIVSRSLEADQVKVVYVNTEDNSDKLFVVYNVGKLGDANEKGIQGIVEMNF